MQKRRKTTQNDRIQPQYGPQNAVFAMKVLRVILIKAHLHFGNQLLQLRMKAALELRDRILRARGTQLPGDVLVLYGHEERVLVVKFLLVLGCREVRDGVG